MTTAWPSKHPDAIADYAYDIPLDAEDTVSSATLSLLSGSVQIDSQSLAGARLTAWLSGGIMGETAVFRVMWNTAGGRTDDDIITLPLAVDSVAILSGIPSGDPNIASFSYPAFIARYPELKAVEPEQAQALFAEAGLYLDNTICSPVQDVPTRLVFLNMIVAHLAALSGALDGGVSSGMVGRVTEASEGSVRVKVDTGMSPGTAQWWNLTTYGLNFWAATKRYRGMHYVPGAEPMFDPLYAVLRQQWPL